MKNQCLNKFIIINIGNLNNDDELIVGGSGGAIAAGISGEETETLSDAAKGSGGIGVAEAEGEGSGVGESHAP